MLTTIAALSKLVLEIDDLVITRSIKSEHDSVGGLGCYFNVSLLMQLQLPLPLIFLFTQALQYRNSIGIE